MKIKNPKATFNWKPTFFVLCLNEKVPIQIPIKPPKELKTKNMNSGILLSCLIALNLS